MYRLHFQGCFTLTKLTLFSSAILVTYFVNRVGVHWSCESNAPQFSHCLYIKKKICCFFFVQAKVLFRIIQNVFWLLGIYGTVYADNSGKNWSKFDCFITLYWLYETGFHIDINLISVIPVFRVPPLWMMGRRCLIQPGWGKKTGNALDKSIGCHRSSTETNKPLHPHFQHLSYQRFSWMMAECQSIYHLCQREKNPCWHK